MQDIFWIWFFFNPGTYWISNSTKFDETFQSLIPLTIVAIPAFLGIFYGISSIICGPFLKRNLGSVMLFIGAFSFIDYLRSKIFSGFPWNLWGTAGLGYRNFTNFKPHRLICI